MSIPSTIILISAETQAQLQSELDDLLKLAEHDQSVNLASIAQKYNSRNQKPWRTALTVQTVPELVECLQRKTYFTAQAPSAPHSIGFLFTSQGSQYFGMTRSFYEYFPVFKASLDRYEAIYKELTGEEFKHGIWTENVFLTVFSQPVLLCIQMALVDLWRSIGVVPTAVMGHSFGEYGAAVYAGALSFSDALQLSIDRFRLVMKTVKSCPGKMIGVTGSEVEVEGLMSQFERSLNGPQHWLDVSAVNSPEEVVVAGPKETLDAFEEFCNGAGLRTRVTPSPVAFHSRAMDPIMPEFAQCLKKIDYGRELTCAYMSATLGRAATISEMKDAYWLNHLRQRMHCGKALVYIWAKCKILIEIGPREVLVHKVRENIAATSKDEDSGRIFATVKRDDESCANFYSVLTQLYFDGVDLKVDKLL